MMFLLTSPNSLTTSSLGLCPFPSQSGFCIRVPNCTSFTGEKMRRSPSGSFRNSLGFESKISSSVNKDFFDELEPDTDNNITDRSLPENHVSFHEKMLKLEPGNPLFLRNYAKFLEEVVGDLDKAEEYYERAIVANPSDGEVLSLYADFIWENHRDLKRAENYFLQAMQANPNDRFQGLKCRRVYNLMSASTFFAICYKDHSESAIKDHRERIFQKMCVKRTEEDGVEGSMAKREWHPIGFLRCSCLCRRTKSPSL